MNVYTTDKIRNVVILGHGGAGKTSLVESMAYLSGITSRLGNVAEGNTVSDFDKEEVKRKFSISTSMIPIIWGDTKINILDTPGYFDFVGEAEEAAAAADAAIIVVNGKNGVEVGTEKAWDLCEKYKLPRFFYVSNMDYDNASYREVVEKLTELYGKKIAPLFLPIRENEKFVGYVNVVKMAARRYVNKNEKVECEIPDYSREYLDHYRENLLEAVAETSEEFMDRYFSGEEFSEAEIVAALHANVSDCSIVPVTMGASLSLQGIVILLDDIVSYMPSPESRKIAGVNMKTKEIFEADYNFAKAKSAFIFKTIVDPFIGKYSLIKIASGVIKSDDVLYNEAKDTEDRISKLYVLEGSRTIEVKELHAGDIGAIGKLNASTGDTLSTKANPIAYGKIEVSTPYTYKRYRAKVKGEEDKIAQALAKMAQEDLTLKVVNDGENRQTLLYGMGDQHLDIIASQLLSKYKVEMMLEKPKVAFRETIRKSSDVDSKYKKQSGGHGQYGHVKMEFAPYAEGDYLFQEKIFGGSVPKNFHPAVDKGIREAMEHGVLAGYPMVGLRATLLDGSYHDVDSNELSFKMAARLAYKAGIPQANPVLLEPVCSLKVVIPDSYMGDVIGDLNKRRGRIMGMNPLDGGKQEIVAECPMAELGDYAIKLRSMTQGRGSFVSQFERYDEAPVPVQEKVIAANKARLEALNKE